MYTLVYSGIFLRYYVLVQADKFTGANVSLVTSTDSVHLPMVVQVSRSAYLFKPVVTIVLYPGLPPVPAAGLPKPLSSLQRPLFAHLCAPPAPGHCLPLSRWTGAAGGQQNLQHQGRGGGRGGERGGADRFYPTTRLPDLSTGTSR